MDSNNPRPIDPQVRIGHVHLKVADLERALRFYLRCARFRGDSAVRHAGRVRVGRRPASTIPPSFTPRGRRRPLPCGVSSKPACHWTGRAITGSEALYLRDPDDNGVELYWDLPPEQWPRTPGGELAMFTRRLDLNGLLREIESDEPVAKIGEGPRDL